MDIIIMTYIKAKIGEIIPCQRSRENGSVAPPKFTICYNFEKLMWWFHSKVTWPISKMITWENQVVDRQ